MADAVSVEVDYSKANNHADCRSPCGNGNWHLGNHGYRRYNSSRKEMAYYEGANDATIMSQNDNHDKARMTSMIADLFNKYKVQDSAGKESLGQKEFEAFLRGVGAWGGKESFTDIATKKSYVDPMQSRGGPTGTTYALDGWNAHWEYVLPRALRFAMAEDAEDDFDIDSNDSIDSLIQLIRCGGKQKKRNMKPHRGDKTDHVVGLAIFTHMYRAGCRSLEADHDKCMSTTRLADTQAEMDAAFASGDYVTAAGLADTLADLQRAQPAIVGRAAALVDEWGSNGLAEP